ncbi:MAG: Maf family protein [Cellvibrionaceae bacterium]
MSKPSGINPSADIYLASRSPRRRELLSQIGVNFDVLTVDVLEQREPQESPECYVQRLSLLKASAGLEEHKALLNSKPVMGADTIVVLNNEVLEKPRSKANAVDMLLSLSGQSHKVMTSVSLVNDREQKTVLNITEVTFRTLTHEEADDYWQTGEPSDKAGGYGIQGLGAIFVEQIKGSYSSVVGLPLLETTQLLQTFNVPIWQKCACE